MKRDEMKSIKGGFNPVFAVSEGEPPHKPNAYYNEVCNDPVSTETTCIGPVMVAQDCW